MVLTLHIKCVIKYTLLKLQLDNVNDEKANLLKERDDLNEVKIQLASKLQSSEENSLKSVAELQANLEKARSSEADLQKRLSEVAQEKSRLTGLTKTAEANSKEIDTLRNENLRLTDLCRSGLKLNFFSFLLW